MTHSEEGAPALTALARYCESGVQLSDRDGTLHVDVPEGVDHALLPERSTSLDAQLLRVLRRAQATVPAGSTVLPLSWTQQRMYFASHQEGAQAVSTVPHALRLRGPLDTAALRTALEHLVAHHPMLRASVLTVGTQVVQRIAPASAPELPVIDLTGVPSAQRESTGLSCAREVMAEPFDLAHDPLFRPTLMRLAPDDHVLLMPMHHLVTDGLSLPVINRTLLNVYARVRESATDYPPAPRSDYRAFIADQFGEQAATQTARHHAYWQKRMADAPALLALPTDHPRPSAPTFQGRPVEHRLRAELTARLEAFARSRHITPFMLFSAALHILLARYSGQDDITVGYPFAGRLRPEQADVVGPHISTLLQRVQSGDDPTVLDLLARVRKEILTGTGHHRLRFDKLVQSLGLTRTTAHHPLFQVLIGYNGKAQPLPEAAGIRAELFIVDTGAARFDLELYLRPDGDEMAIMLWAQRDLFEEDTARRILRHLEHLLRQMLTAPDQPISRLALMPEDEAAQALSLGTGAVPEKVTTGVAESVAAIAHRHPGRVAVRMAQVSLTYAELDARVRAAAHRLRALGVGTDDIVGVHADRSPDLIIAVLAILRSGGAYLPLDPSLPSARLQAMVEDARPVAVVVDTAQVTPPPGPVPIPLAELTAASTAGTDDLPAPPQASLAYVIFTSGSTGRPKGVMNTHEALNNRLAWMQRAYPLDATDTVLQKTPLSFDVSVWELLWPLTVGATLAVAAPGGHRDPAYLGRIIQQEGVTVLHFVPSMLRAFLTADQARSLTGVRHVVCSGEALTAGLREDFTRLCDARLHNLYGPTEAAIDVTAHECVDPSSDGDTVPIGRPISGVSVHVLGPRGELLPPGVIGELHIGGIGLARGYVGRPELTADRFVPSPLGEPGARLYRTGDLGRRLTDGSIEFLGRNDGQVKLRGFRIELSEVESAIERVPGVRQAVAALWTGPSGKPVLVAYLTCSQEDPHVVQTTRDALAQWLPEYMVPTQWTVLPHFPLLPSGKVDRSALPQPDSPRGPDEDEGDQAWTDRETLLAQLWERTLGVPPRSPRDDFFLLGGDSILSIDLVSAARAAGLELTVEKVFQNPVLTAMAAVADDIDTSQVPTDTAPFALVPPSVRTRLPAGVEDAFPLSRLLAGLYYESTANPDYRVYTTSLRLRGEFDASRMRAALKALVDRHPFLRSSIDVTSFDEPLQLVHTHIPDALTVVDLRELDPSHQRTAFDQWFTVERDRSFDWQCPPLLVLTAHLMSDDEFQLTLTEPFLDGWSVALAVNELLDNYRELAMGPLPQPEPVRAQTDFLLLESAACKDPGARDYWLGVLSDPPPAGLPGRSSSGYEVRPVRVTAETSDGLQALAESLAVPLKSVLMAAHVQVVSLLTGRRDVLTGLMANSRPENAHGAAAVGMFLNTTPIRVNVGTGSTVDDIRRVHAAEAGALTHRGYPYAQMLQDARIDTPFDTTFNYTHFRPYEHRTHDSGPQLLSLRATDQTYHRLTAQFRRDVLSGGVGLFLEFSDAGLSDAHMDGIAGYYEEALRHMASSPHAPASPLDRLRAAETPRVQDTSHDLIDEESDLFDRFTRQAQHTPRAEALRWEGEAVRYADLAEDVARLSAHLAAHGVSEGTVVPVCLERTPAYAAAVLAVLRLGASYAPMDPSQPRERLRTLLSAAAGPVALGNTARLPVPSGTVALDVSSPPAPGWVPAVSPDPGRTAAVVFTSGSTGQPKAVALPHTAIMNRLDWSTREEPAGPDEVFAMRTPIGFVDSIAELFDGLLRGVPTVIVPERVQAPEDLIAVLSRSNVTKLTLVPTLLAEILRTGTDLAAVLPNLRTWHLSGEPLRASLAHALHDQLPNARIRNIYGSTEVCADATTHLVTGRETGRVPVGTPLSGVTVHVLHEDGGTVPDGTVGELAIGGACLAQGYQADAAMTALRFAPAPGTPGLRVYRTGDLAVRSRDGSLELLGRADRQIKVRGVRIEPAEVEAALTCHPQIDEALVVQRERDHGKPVLAGYLLLNSATPPSAAELRRFLLDRLLPASIPEALVPVTGWPRLPSGKIDAAALPRLETGLITTRPRLRPPSGLLETELATLWEQRLGELPSDVSDDFFDLGGNSLHAIVLAGLVSRWTDSPVKVADIFNNPTLAEQALMIERILVNEGSPPMETKP
ncbi:non-ribosomal peptide synthetase [Nocardiopsis sp. YSL2]|uniref:non-ribosomal peptide synthetase n=1 Tax=Nocardiopsis sp. YSL2 TaxID=2939492 RepID=UPI0026F46781|nr:non-ribosomal peptide synthetase [Nocardiopsis sp. YSL2]